MARVYLSLSSNLGDRLGCLKAAVTRLRSSDGIRFLSASTLYETEPWESEPGQPVDRSRWYLNCAVVIDTTLAPTDLLERVQQIETALGRQRPDVTLEAARFAPRPLDIDILFYENRVISIPDRLQIPHLLLHERAFVLRPLAELAPELEHPILYQTIQDLLSGLEDEHAVQRGDFPARWFED
jgi:2-amino-4-hydroxy-6-hydroxymethyldihydropteridine diphosphokinase